MGGALILIVFLAAAVAAAIRRKHGALFIGSTSALFWAVIWVASSQLGDPTLRRLEHLNREVNALEASAPAPGPDPLDGEDKALLKKARLTGLPARLVVMDDPAGGRRAVLAVKTEGGEWILDDRSSKPRRRLQLVRDGYRFTDRDPAPQPGGQAELTKVSGPES